jgi:hypothetical protein
VKSSKTTFTLLQWGTSTSVKTTKRWDELSRLS